MDEIAEVVIDLLLLNGQMITVSCPNKHEDSFYQAISQAIKRGDEWSVMMFDGCSADYLGHSLEKINMAQVVGRL